MREDDFCSLCGDSLADHIEIKVLDTGPHCGTCIEYRVKRSKSVSENNEDDDDLQNRASVVFTFRLAA